MEKVLLVLGVIFIYLAISTRHKLHKDIDNDQNQQSVDSALKTDEQSPESLTYALNKMTGAKPVPFQPQPPAPPPNTARSGKPQATPMSGAELIAEVRKDIDAIQVSNQDSPMAFEKALDLTRGPENLTLRLTVFQAAQSMQVDSFQARSLAIRETQSLVVANPSNPENPTPEEATLRDLQRNTVIAAYKVYMLTSQDVDLVYNDTAQALSFQTDPWVRRQIIFECVSRFPQLREKLNE